MRLSLVYWLHSLYFAWFFVEIILIVGVEGVGVVAENKVLVHLAFLML